VATPRQGRFAWACAMRWNRDACTRATWCSSSAWAPGTRLAACFCAGHPDWCREGQGSAWRFLSNDGRKAHLQQVPLLHRKAQGGGRIIITGLDGFRKAGIVTNGPGVLGIAGSDQGHHSRVEGSLPSVRSSEGEK